MAKSISQKLRITEKSSLLVLNPPENFLEGLGKLPPGVKIKTEARDYDQVHWFVKNRAQLEKELSKVMKLVRENVIVWVYYPKGSSGIQTDLTRDKGWECLLAEDDKLTWINLISFDNTWSVFGFRAKTEADSKKATRPKTEREIFKWIDPVSKKVSLPPDMEQAIRENKKAAEFFNSLSFTNKKEYVEWIVTAKREDTRMEGIRGTIERLNKEWKNPRNI